jgi:hypothetical protein
MLSVCVHVSQGTINSMREREDLDTGSNTFGLKKLEPKLRRLSTHEYVCSVTLHVPGSEVARVHFVLISAGRYVPQEFQ